MNNIIKILFKYSLLFSYGGMTYILIELAWRQKTTIEMLFCGAISFVLIGLINEVKISIPLFWQGMVGSFFIVTPLEYFFGIIFNTDYHIWDYRSLPLNYDGQICLLFSVLWIFVSIFAIVLDDIIRYYIFEEEKPNYKIF